jgi:hypothetical protein
MNKILTIMGICGIVLACNESDCFTINIIGVAMLAVSVAIHLLMKG